jgi:hypothetical protein
MSHHWPAIVTPYEGHESPSSYAARFGPW